MFLRIDIVKNGCDRATRNKRNLDMYYALNNARVNIDNDDTKAYDVTSRDRLHNFPSFQMPLIELKGM